MFMIRRRRLTAYRQTVGMVRILITRGQVVMVVTFNSRLDNGQGDIFQAISGAQPVGASAQHGSAARLWQVESGAAVAHPEGGHDKSRGRASRSSTGAHGNLSCGVHGKNGGTGRNPGSA